MHDTFAETLLSSGPHPSLGEHAQTYARVIGSWVGQLHNHMLGHSVPPASVEAHFAWVLDGRAVQDVWITPARSDRSPAAKASLDWYGSTLRVFEPASGAWRSVWTDPVSQLRIELLGRSQGADIVQIGTRGGRPIRWTFSQIQHQSFVWEGHILNLDGKTWDLEVEMRFRRIER
jgi:hypothetical protein